MRLRLQNSTGVSPNGVARSREYGECLKRHGSAWGKRKALRCPYWVGGTHTCGIWPDRDPICRTWFCRHNAGSFGMQRWEKLRQLLLHVEEQVLLFCVRAGDRPGDTAGDDRWLQWFIWCARRSEQLTEEEIASLRTPTLDTLRQELLAEMTRSEPKLPDVVVPRVRLPLYATSGFYLRGYSRWDAVKTTPAVIDLFAQLDGKRSWQRALVAATVARHEDIDEQLVGELFRIGILCPPKAGEGEAGLEGPARDEPLPDVLVPAINAPIVDGDRAWVQSATTDQSLVVPMHVFVLLWKLDGTKPWRTAVREVAAERNEWIDASLIGRMLSMGLLREPDPPKQTPDKSPGP